MESEGNFGMSGDAPSGGFNEQYEKSIMRAAKDGRVSEKWAKEKLSEMKSRDPRSEDTGTIHLHSLWEFIGKMKQLWLTMCPKNPETRTQGVCLLLRNFFAKNRGSSTATNEPRQTVVATSVGTFLKSRH
jgi:hypothetical protein